MADLYLAGRASTSELAALNQMHVSAVMLFSRQHSDGHPAVSLSHRHSRSTQQITEINRLFLSIFIIISNIDPMRLSKARDRHLTRCLLIQASDDIHGTDTIERLLPQEANTRRHNEGRG